MTTSPAPDPDPEPGQGSDGSDEGGAARAPTSLLRWAIVGTVVAFAVAVGIGYAVSRSNTPTYDEASRQRFLEACTADGGDDVRPACECLYAAISERIPYERFDEVHEQLLEAREVGEEIVLPDDMAALLPACQIPA